jgi:hypothetical protein
MPQGAPHGPGGKSVMAAPDAPALVVAKTDSCFSSPTEWHCGHSGVVSERTNASNWWPQSRQAYSKMGMFNSAKSANYPSNATLAIGLSHQEILTYSPYKICARSYIKNSGAGITPAHYFFDSTRCAS